MEQKFLKQVDDNPDLQQELKDKSTKELQLIFNNDTNVNTQKDALTDYVISDNKKDIALRLAGDLIYDLANDNIQLKRENELLDSNLKRNTQPSTYTQIKKEIEINRNVTNLNLKPVISKEVDNLILNKINGILSKNKINIKDIKSIQLNRK